MISITHWLYLLNRLLKKSLTDAKFATHKTLFSYRVSLFSNNAEIGTPKDEDNSSNIKMSGQESPRSHFDTACGVRPSSSASSRCFYPIDAANWQVCGRILPCSASTSPLVVMGALAGKQTLLNFCGDFSFAEQGVFLPV